MVTLDQGGRAIGWTQLFEPPASLHAYAEFFWTQTPPVVRPVGAGWRIVADVNAHIIVSRLRRRDGRDVTRTSLVGPRTRHIDADIRHRSWVAGVRLKAGVLPLLTGLPASDFRDRSVPLADAGAPACADLADRLNGAGGPIDAARRLGQYLEARLPGGTEPDARVGAFGSFLVAHSPSGSRIRDVAAEIGVAERTLRKLCTDSIGLAPVVAVRIERLHGALRLALSSGHGWARIGAMVGYYDQAHMIRECRALLGETPREFLRRGAGAHD